MNAGRAEAAFWAAFLHNRNVDATTAADGAVAVAGGYALYVGATAIDLAIGAGTARPLRADDCEVVEEFFGARGVAARFELDDDVLARDQALLRDRGYAEDEVVLDVFEGAVVRREPDPQIAVRRSEDRTGWVDLVARSFDGTADEPLRPTLQANAAAAGALVIASVGGVDAGAGALGISGDTAILYSAAVLPAFRRRGVHRALLAARLNLAAARGATTAVLKTGAGAPFTAALERNGFARTVQRRRLRREPR